MKWFQTAWPTLRDVVITGTGLIIVWSQLLLWDLYDRQPSDVLLAIGMGFTVPAATAHVRTVLSAAEPEAGSSSSSSPPPSPPPSSPPQEATRDRAG